MLHRWMVADLRDGHATRGVSYQHHSVIASVEHRPQQLGIVDVSRRPATGKVDGNVSNRHLVEECNNTTPCLTRTTEAMDEYDSWSSHWVPSPRSGPYSATGPDDT